MLFHSTSAMNAQAILAEGFRDEDQYVSDSSHPRRQGDWVLAVEWDGTEDELNAFVWNTRAWPPHGNDYREWRVGGRRLNRCGVVVVRRS